MTIVAICRTTSEHSFRVEFASLLKILNPMRNVCAWMLANEQFLMLAHDVSSGPECCKPVTNFKPFVNSGCADVLLTRRAAIKEVQYDALVQSQQVRVDAALVRERDKWNRFGVTKFLSKKQLNDIMKRNPNHNIVGTRWVFTEKVIQGKPDCKARLVVQGCQEDKGYIRTARGSWFCGVKAGTRSLLPAWINWT